VDLSIIIVNHNTQALTQSAVASLFRHTAGIDWEVILVDNSDQKRERIDPPPEKSIKLIQVENKGFSHGCNTGARLASGRNLLFLNSDTLISSNLLPECIRYMDEHREVGVLGIKILLPDGRLDHGCKRGFPSPARAFYYLAGFDQRYPKNPKYCGYRLLHLDPDEIHSIDAVSGAFLMTPKAVFEEVGGFDETFFMYGEDLDYCFRVKKAGRQVIYYPKSSILHLKGQSGRHHKKDEILYHFYNAMKQFYRKHYQTKYGIGMSLIVYTAITGLYYLERSKNEGHRTGGGLR